MSSDQIERMRALRRTAHSWREKLADPSTTPEDREAFKNWRAANEDHALAYDRAVTFDQALGELRRQDFRGELFETSSRERFLGGLVRPLRRGHFKIGLVSAGVVAAAVMAGLSLQILDQTVATNDAMNATVIAYETSGNEIRDITLSDGSVMTIGRTTEVQTSFTETSRTVTLIKGAAIFDVAPETARPFSVEAGELTATALGTAFDVRFNGGTSRVAVQEGSVSVSYPFILDGALSSLTTQQKLSQGEQVFASADFGLSNIFSIDPSDVGAWREGRLIYRNASVEELVADANRYDNRMIKIENGSETIAGLTLTGSFSSNNIDRMLLSLQDVHPIDVIFESDEQVVLRRRDPVN